MYQSEQDHMAPHHSPEAKLYFQREYPVPLSTKELYIKIRPHVAHLKN